MSRQAIRVRRARGGLHPLYRGVYAVGHEALTQTARFVAAALACGDGAVLADYAAAAYLGLLTWRARDIDVIVPRGGGRRIDGIRAHRRKLDRRDAWPRDAIRVTTPARTISTSPRRCRPRRCAGSCARRRPSGSSTSARASRSWAAIEDTAAPRSCAPSSPTGPRRRAASSRTSSSS